MEPKICLRLGRFAASKMWIESLVIVQMDIRCRSDLTLCDNPRCQPMKFFDNWHYIPAILFVLSLTSCDSAGVSTTATLEESGLSLSAPELASAVETEYLAAEVTIAYTVSSQQIDNTVTAVYDAVTGLWKANLTIPPNTDFTLDVTWYDIQDAQGRRANLTTTSTRERSGNIDSSLNLSFDFSDYDNAQFDSDSDGVSNLEERENGTDPFVSEGGLEPGNVPESEQELESGDSVDEELLLLAINEGQAINIEFFSEQPVREANWVAQPYEAENNSACNGEVQFDAENSVWRLENACTLEEDCFLRIGLAEAGLENGLGYTVQGPEKLMASVPLAYELQVIDSAFNPTVYPVLFCLGAENQSPTAVDDTHVILLDVANPFDAYRDLTLLDNDIDDNHIGNESLVLNTTLVESPASSSAFSIESDGTFAYQYDGDATSVDPAGETDSFVYSVSDGNSSSTARVTLNIVNEDSPPVMVSEVPTLVIPVGVYTEIDLALYVEDPEGGKLFFDFGYERSANISDVSMAVGFNGTGFISPPSGSEGDYFIEYVAVDDAGKYVEESFIEFILNFQVVENSQPIATVIPENVIDAGFDSFYQDISSYFSDPEGVALNFTLTSVPAANISIDPVSGNITGLFPDVGIYELTVSATDRFNAPVTSSFSVVVE